MHLILHLDNTHVTKFNDDCRVATICSTHNNVIVFRTWFGLVAKTFLRSIERELLSHSQHLKDYIWIWIDFFLKVKFNIHGVWMVTPYFGTLASTLICAMRLAHANISAIHTILYCIHYHGIKIEYQSFFCGWSWMNEQNNKFLYSNLNKVICMGREATHS